ncbi:tRNA (adenosine(37)-N6)-threonylcarbamoyltransferase complex ATPase subunit type 1 TsaE [Aquisalimonas lutea]|uniref:tRNA (adenosine(37)-N6)-threonylcarbamoyltransferase complex ATPase subunit type 1 TsaE n=1 Tax=Aquisalimonas lutea TaxID=1327750 RepID=UPI0025B5CB18|nr:tRNA (adenosine(37)-N6)-threonylcarbamoyltransferase complex ATPase subunit type 1 TsaE [Aquisalimonas lutea]MDN3519294.1 tRNA (adenosine(37)-N6)-threonylcarbamoyltransferase complex ATPase subunit type 1 TsaE [Aquisalimonas lutea]
MKDSPDGGSRRTALPDAAATEALGAALWRSWPGGQCVVLLDGDLGAGKTTLVRGLLRAAGHDGAVRSPTYTLMEPYELTAGRVVHLDLYRLADAEELEYLGLRDELGPGTLILVEWPERGRGVLPAGDLHIALADANHGREATLTALTPVAAVMAHPMGISPSDQ